MCFFNWMYRLLIPLLLLIDGPLWPLHISSMKKKTEKRACRERTRGVEHGSFSPLVFSVFFGGSG